MNRSKLFPEILALIGALHLAACTAPAALPDEPQVQAVNAVQVFTTDDGVRLPVRTYIPDQRPQAVLLALHGFNDSSRAFEDAAPYFAQAGIKTIAYDQRGFGGAPDRGTWAGTEVMAQDFLAILRTVRRDHPDQPLFVLGESMGGAVIAVALAQETDVRIDGVVLASAGHLVTRHHALVSTLRDLGGLGAGAGHGLEQQPIRHRASDNVAMLAKFAQDPLVIRGTRMDTLAGLSDLMDQAIVSVPRLRQRTLVTYGLRDVMMPRRPMIAMLERWPQDATRNFRFGLYPEGYHMILRDMQRAVVWKDIVSWMLDPDASLPSGFERERAEVLRQLRMPGD